ncbi:MAG TPA: adenylate kinase family protein [Candidatus Thermoplasmatota archaeon]|nr:adenylate kinase family protein [Candidatus Thermoplasmatota archaeon]
MLVALTGTPGVGKTTVSDLAGRLRPGARVVHLGDWLAEAGLLAERDPARGSFEVDTRRMRRAFRLAHADVPAGTTVLVESHLAHHLDVDACLLLRVDPATLHRRLSARGWSEAKVRENVEAEALDVLAAEVRDHFGGDACDGPLAPDEKPWALELDATTMPPEAVAAAVWEAVDAGGRASGEGFKWRAVGSVAWPLDALPWL